jgi:hypothetical protein
MADDELWGSSGDEGQPSRSTTSDVRSFKMRVAANPEASANLDVAKQKKKTKPKITLKMKIKPKAKTEEEMSIEKKVMKRRKECFEEQLRLAMDALTAPPADILPIGMHAEVMDDDVESGFAGARWEAIIREYKTDGEARRYLVEYTTYEEDDAAESLKKWKDAKFVRPIPPVAAMVEYERGEQVDIVFEADDRGWYPGVVLRNNGEEGYDVETYFDGETHMVLRPEDIRHHVDWTGTKVEENAKRGNGGWQFVKAPNKTLAVDDSTNGVTEDWKKSLDKGDEGDEDFTAADKDLWADADSEHELDSDTANVNSDDDGSDFSGKNDSDYDGELLDEEPEYKHVAKKKSKQQMRKKRKLVNELINQTGGRGARQMSRKKPKKGGKVRLFDNFRNLKKLD